MSEKFGRLTISALMGQKNHNESEKNEKCHYFENNFNMELLTPNSLSSSQSNPPAISY